MGAETLPRGAGVGPEPGEEAHFHNTTLALVEGGESVEGIIQGYKIDVLVVR